MQSKHNIQEKSKDKVSPKAQKAAKDPELLIPSQIQVKAQ